MQGSESPLPFKILIAAVGTGSGESKYLLDQMVDYEFCACREAAGAREFRYIPGSDKIPD